MLGFVVRRLAATLVVLLVASFIVYVLTAMSGDPLADLRSAGTRDALVKLASLEERLNLDVPPALRYFLWLGGAAGCLIGRCDLGISIAQGEQPWRIASRYQRALWVVREVQEPLLGSGCWNSGVWLGLPGLGCARKPSNHWSAIRSTGQFGDGQHSAVDAGHVGARLLPRLPERQSRLRQGLLEHCELGRRCQAFRLCKRQQPVSAARLGPIRPMARGIDNSKHPSGVNLDPYWY